MSPEMYTFLVTVLLITVYLLPALVAVRNKHPHGAGIFALDLLLGWTFLGWVIALVWALVVPKES